MKEHMLNFDSVPLFYYYYYLSDLESHLLAKGLFF